MPKPTTTPQQFAEAVARLFGDQYDCSKVHYVNNSTRVTIICKDHGEFVKRPADMTVKKSGCPTCAKSKYGAYHKKDSTWFAEEGVRVHGNKYNYSQVQYVRYHQKVDIICPDHGVFRQTAGSHISNGSGCPTCSVKDYEGGYSRARFISHPEIQNNPATLYLIECHRGDEAFIKIGITQKTIHDRFRINNRLPYDFTILAEHQGALYELFQLEQAIKIAHKRFKHTPLVPFNGKSECFALDVKHEVLAAIGNPAQSRC